ncbi:MAG TPA: hypothetical protein VL737_00990 [Candidatus Pristimantibacillus sp.]|jgi:hypothetical protein|nr:hypothetical protein [Candidatus Pristimantibacillus sp.]
MSITAAGAPSRIVAPVHPELCRTCEVNDLSGQTLADALDGIRDFREALTVADGDTATETAARCPLYISTASGACALRGCLERHQTDQCVKLL